jgi:8-oxo-dGTP diphosphatase
MNFPSTLLVSRCFIKRNGLIIILHRNISRSYNPGKWELPGGKVEVGQDINSATEREILEETGLLVKIISPLTFTETKIVDRGKYKGMLYLELVNEAHLISGSVIISNDHQAFKWVKPKKALNDDLSLEARKAITFFIGRK